jgi:hypothetical protein
LRFLSRQIVDVSAELPRYQPDLLVLLGGQHRFALQLDEAIEPHFTINDAGEYFFNRFGAVELAQLVQPGNKSRSRPPESTVRGRIEAARGRASC